jgi:hypothetical protein
MIVANNPNRIINSKAASTQTVVTDMGGSSSGEMIYRCGPHDFETKSLKEFNEHVTRLPHNDSGRSSKAASSTEESIIEGVPHYTVNKVKVIQDFLASNGKVNDAVGTVSKAASVPGINKLRVIHDFIKSNGRI